MRPASICLFTDSLEPSGVGQHMLTLARELTRTHRLSLVCAPSTSGAALLEKARALDLTTMALEVRTTPAEIPLAEWLRVQRIDLLHVHAGIGWEGHHGVYAARKAGVPVVRTEHLPYLLTHSRQREDYRRVEALTDRIICVSAAARDSYAAVGVPAAKLRVVHNGIHCSPAPADCAGIRARLGLVPEARLVLTVARFTEQKGHRFLLEAAPAVLKHLPETRFVWIGDGPLRSGLQRRVGELGIAEQVRFLGRRKDVPALLAAADLLVLPSLFEGLPLVVLEAMAAGVPVVGTRVCGTAEAIEDGVCGRLVEPGDPAALAAAIREVFESPERTAEWSRAGRERVRDEFSAARMARKTATVYREVIRRLTHVYTKGEAWNSSGSALLARASLPTAT